MRQHFEVASAHHLDNCSTDGLCRFGKGDYVQVQLENAAIRIRKPHLRTPGYIFGLVGIVERECVGMADNPEGLAFRQVSLVFDKNCNGSQYHAHGKHSCMQLIVGRAHLKDRLHYCGIAIVCAADNPVDI